MKSAFRHAVAILSVVTLSGLLPGLAHAQGKMLKILVGYAPGGAVDVVARQVGEELRQSGYNAIVENKSGAGGRLAVEQLLNAPADGSTVVLMPGGNVSIFTHLYSKLNYKLEDLAPLATVCSFEYGLAVGAGTPARTLSEFIGWAKANPGKASYGTPGAGTAMHFMGVMLVRNAGFEFIHVPYRGGAAAVTDAIGGNISALTSTLPNLFPIHKNGKLRILAITGDKRLPSLPEVPTFKEMGYPDLVISESFGFYASAKVPEGVQAELERALMAAASKPRVVAALEKLEFSSDVTGRAAFLSQMKTARERWGQVIRTSGFKAED